MSPATESSGAVRRPPPGEPVEPPVDPAVAAKAAQVDRIRRRTGALATAVVRRMDEQLDWYRGLSAQDRSWVGLVAQAGISAFLAWFQRPAAPVALTADVFGTAPRELTRSISLQQTLELVRTVIDTVEDNVADLAEPGGEQVLREAALRYSREVAFAAAHVYARAAEARGAWDARLEALVVDALVRDEADASLASQAAALGWPASLAVVVVAGAPPVGTTQVTDVADAVRRQARSLGGDALCGVQHDRVVVVLGHQSDPVGAAAEMAVRFGPGPVVTGPPVAGLAQAARSARAAISGFSAAPAWPGAPRLVSAADLLPERVLAGDQDARHQLLESGYRPLETDNPVLLETLSTYLDLGGVLEAAARDLFVHPNTVRYRLGRVTKITGWDPTAPRDAFTLRCAITVGRLDSHPKPHL